ncbi:MAG: TIR domain-containing protein [Chlorobiales bacterium]|nr:TIR domain-containing protein [Chlorobiales bacterium]
MSLDYNKLSKEELIKHLELIIRQRAVSYEDRMKLAFLDEAPFTIWACDINRKIKLWEGKCEIIYNKKKEQVIGSDFVEEFVSADEKEDAIEDCENIISTGQHVHNLAEDKDCFGHKIMTLYTHCFRVYDVETQEPLQAEMAVRINVQDELMRFERIKERGRILDVANKDKKALNSRCDKLIAKLNNYLIDKVGADNEIQIFNKSLYRLKNELEKLFLKLLINTKKCETAEACRVKYEEASVCMNKLELDIESINEKVNNIKIKKKKTTNKRFKVALSFPGEYREIIKNIANKLSDRYTKERILYDHFHRAEFARPNLDTHLQKLYNEDSELIVVCLCGKYNEKRWCGLEWRAIRDLINQKKSDSIMFLRVDEGDVDGVFGSLDGHVEVTKNNINEVTEEIIKRYQEL